MTLSQADPGGYGHLGTPNAGRAERMARAERHNTERFRGAAARLGRRDLSEGELRSLRQEIRALRDAMNEQRASLPALVEGEVVRILADQLPDAFRFLAGKEVSRNGSAAQASS
jgi:hypothetical protein